MTAPSAARPRKPWAACLLSLLTPGLGHLYAGEWRAAIAAFLLFELACAAAGAFGVFAPWAPLNILVMVAVPVAALAGVAYGAVRAARRAPRDSPRRAYDRWPVYAAVVLLAAFVTQQYTALLRRDVVRAFRLPSRSMQPTLLAGDFLFVRPIVRPAAVVRGEIVVHKSLTEEGVFVIKRVAGTPGDTLQMIGGRLAVNGAPEATRIGPGGDVSSDVSDPGMNWQRRFLVSGVDSAAYRPSRDNWGPIVVPPDACFVLGDNRDNAYDSRYWGFLPAGMIFGRPVRIYLSFDPDSPRSFLAAVRWDRIGRAVR